MKQTIRSFQTLTLVLLMAGLIGCGQAGQETNDSTWEKVDSESLEPPLSELYNRAERARQDLGKTLFGRLSEVLSNQGPQAAIEVCNLEAQGMTRDVGEKYNVAIGRTSFRLRNPDNQPPDWAVKFDLVDNRVAEQVVLKKEDQHLAVFTPIHLAPKCATCHGPKEQIPKGVRQELEKRYPKDRATEFEPGDLRGWFWVEVPGRPADS